MKKLAVALLATTVMGTPVAFAASDNSQPPGQQTQQNKKQQTQMDQSGQNAQNQNQNKQNAQNEQKQNQRSAQDQQQANQKQSAENNQSISPDSLSRSDIKQVQQALLKDGFHAGPVDGLWGPDTKNAVKKFQESKQMQPTGELDHQTVADLGLDASQFSQSQNQQQ